MDWQPIETAPKDGTWVIIHLETGGDVFEPRVGRWKPRKFDDLGTYEWEVVDRRPTFDESVPADDVINNWSDGRVSGWQPLPT